MSLFPLHSPTQSYGKFLTANTRGNLGVILIIVSFSVLCLLVTKRETKQENREELMEKTLQNKTNLAMKGLTESVPIILHFHPPRQSGQKLQAYLPLYGYHEKG